jgi:hypothetical protein
MAARLFFFCGDRHQPDAVANAGIAPPYRIASDDIILVDFL